MSKPPIYKNVPSYKRNNRHHNYYIGPTKVDLYWSQKAGSYTIKWHDTNHFDEMKPIMSYLKMQPYGEWQYDPDNKIWYFMEKYLANVLAMLDTLKPLNIFDVTFVPKPENQVFQTKFISIDTYLDKFKVLTGFDCRNSEFKIAKKEYFKACMKLHPDKGNDPQNMTDLNVAWDAIQSEYFKIKKEIVYDIT